MTLEHPSYQKSLHRATLLVLLITMLILQFSAVAIRSFWEDEAFTAQLVKDDPDVIMQRLASDVHPPLYWLLASAWSKVFGGEEWGLKTFSVLCLGLVFVLTYKLAADMFDPRVALISVSLLTFSPFVLTFGHNARYYSLSAALSLLVVWMVYAFITTHKWWYLGIYILSASALLYTMYLGAVLLFAVNIWLIIQWLHQKQKLARFLMWTGAQFIIVLLYVPWINTLWVTLEERIPSDIVVSSWIKEIVWRVGYLGYVYAVGEFFSPLNLLVWIALVIIVFAILYALKHSTQNFWILLLILVASQIPSIFSTIVGVYPLSSWQGLPNRTFFLYPFFVIVLAFGLRQFKGKWFWGALAVILIIYGVGIFNYFTHRQVIKPILIVPWHEIFANIQTQVAEDAVVVCTNEDTACFYYQIQSGFDRFTPISWIQLPEPKPAEVWWIQSHRGDFVDLGNQNSQVFDLINAQYELADVFYYVPQDPGIALLKARFLGTADYDHRVVVYRFALP